MSPIPPSSDADTVDSSLSFRDVSVVPLRDAADSDGSQSGPVQAALSRPLSVVETTVYRARLSTRLLGRSAAQGLWAWLGPLLVTVLAGLLRFWSLNKPGTLIFDETYYVKDAYSLLTQGYEGSWVEDTNPQFEAGDFSGLLATPEYYVHPPVGKWVMAFGQWLLGSDNPAGWRLSGAICGTIAVWLIARIARRIFSSNLLGTTAGLLMAIDGNAIVMSRTGILDVFVMFFALCAFGALLLDRDQMRSRLVDKATQRASTTGVPTSRWWPRVGFRWWRVAAGVSLGLCIGTKWSGMYFLAVFALMSVFWDVNARRLVADEPLSLWQMVWTGTVAFVREGIPAFFALVGVAAVTYLSSWWSWFLHPKSYGRTSTFPDTQPDGVVENITSALNNLWTFHQQMWTFHTGLSSPHDYMSSPWGWTLQWRPTSFYYESNGGCGSSNCSEAITSLGNPLIWWGATIALLAVVLYWALGRDWRAGAVLSGLAAGWLPWFMYSERTIYTFYTVAFEPWIILIATFGLGLLLGRSNASASRRMAGAIVAGGLVVLAVLISGFYWPIWSGELITYEFWRLHMWLPSWI